MGRRGGHPLPAALPPLSSQLPPLVQSSSIDPSAAGFIRILPRENAHGNVLQKRCETCGTSHDGSFGAGRFCSSRCARTVGGLAHRRKRQLERSQGARSYSHSSGHSSSSLSGHKLESTSSGKVKGSQTSRRVSSLEKGKIKSGSGKGSDSHNRVKISDLLNP